MYACACMFVLMQPRRIAQLPQYNANACYLCTKSSVNKVPVINRSASIMPDCIRCDLCRVNAIQTGLIPDWYHHVMCGGRVTEFYRQPQSVHSGLYHQTKTNKHRQTERYQKWYMYRALGKHHISITYRNYTLIVLHSRALRDQVKVCYVVLFRKRARAFECNPRAQHQHITPETCLWASRTASETAYALCTRPPQKWDHGDGQIQTCPHACAMCAFRVIELPNAVAHLWSVDVVADCSAARSRRGATLDTHS